MALDQSVGAQDRVYRPPVADLLDLAGLDEYLDVDYSEMGIEAKHVPELVRMVTDPGLALRRDAENRPYAPTHAWRALCQLDAFDAITPLMEWFDLHAPLDDEWFWDELAYSLLELGAGAEPSLNHWLQKEPPTRLASRAAAFGLAEVGKWDDDSRPACVAGLVASLERFAIHTPEFNAYLVSALVELRAGEAIPLIRKAIEAGKVDEEITGPWEELEEDIHSPSDADDFLDEEPEGSAPKSPEFAKNVTGTGVVASAINEKVQGASVELNSPQAIHHGYLPPISALFSLGFYRLDMDLDYVRSFGLSEADLPQLIRLGTDSTLLFSDSDDNAPAAPMHAWKALGQLRSVGAVKPLLQMCAGIPDGLDEVAYENLLDAIVDIGPGILEPVSECISEAPLGNPAAEYAVQILGLLADEMPDLEESCVNRLIAALGRYAEYPRSFNGAVVTQLMALNAVKARPLLEAAYAAGAVECGLTGTWDEVQVHFGWKQPPPLQPKLPKLARGGWEDEDQSGYVSPQPITAPVTPGRNDPCPCGSGKKYKKCCG